MGHYKVCILAAGAGRRMGKFSAKTHKALLPLNDKPIIGHIIEKFPPTIEMVIAVGHMKETVMSGVTATYPQRKCTFVEIKDYAGIGSGPGASLLQCRKALHGPFILTTADTVVLEEIPEPDKNWYGVAPIKNPAEYCTVHLKDGLIDEITDKMKNGNKLAWIGLAGIYDHELFFQSLEKNKELIAGETQVSNGFKGLLGKKLMPHEFTWFDTGTYDKYMEATRKFPR